MGVGLRGSFMGSVAALVGSRWTNRHGSAAWRAEAVRLTAPHNTHATQGGLLSSTEKEVDAILTEVDVDGSGTIDYAEFCAMMTRSERRWTGGRAPAHVSGCMSSQGVAPGGRRASSLGQRTVSGSARPHVVRQGPLPSLPARACPAQVRRVP